jgi:hypothetical protein
MKRTLLALAVCGLLVTSANLAVAQTVYPSDGPARAGGLRVIALYYAPEEAGPVRMPTPKDPLEGPSGFADNDAATFGRGAAIPNSGGGSFMTPRDQADQNIRQLIRKLG